LQADDTGGVSEETTQESDVAAGSEQRLVSGNLARPVTRQAPAYPPSALEKGYEGWVLLSYVVMPDGSCADILIEDASNPIFEEPARKAVEKWEYAPATRDGEPIEQAYTRVLVSFLLVQPPALPRRRFGRTTRAINRQLDARDFDAARSAIRDLSLSFELNVRERSYLYLLEAELERLDGSPERQLASLRRATIDGGRFLEPATYGKALIDLFVLEVERQEIAAALATYRSLDSTGIKVPEWVSEAESRVRGQLATASSLKRRGRIATTREIESGEQPVVWSHEPFLREVGFGDIEGELSRVEFRCEQMRAIDEPTEERAWRLPTGWGRCTIFVTGAPGSSFELIEYRAE